MFSLTSFSSVFWSVEEEEPVSEVVSFRVKMFFFIILFHNATGSELVWCLTTISRWGRSIFAHIGIELIAYLVLYYIIHAIVKYVITIIVVFQGFNSNPPFNFHHQTWSD